MELTRRGVSGDGLAVLRPPAFIITSPSLTPWIQKGRREESRRRSVEEWIVSSKFPLFKFSEREEELEDWQYGVVSCKGWEAFGISDIRRP